MRHRCRRRLPHQRPGRGVRLVQYIGYKTQRTHVGVQTCVDIRLEPSDISLETVVVTALGIKKAEKSLGYSLQQVNSDAFDKVKTDNPINALNGKVAGLTVNTRAGILEDPPIKLRGETPIYVINGTPVTYYRGVSSDDIESITVLKGPQAAVLYGSRGANGAILITTKTGDDIGEKTEITLNSSTMFTAGYLTLPSSRASTVRAISASIPTSTARAAAYTTVCGPGARNSTRKTPPRRAVISRPYSTTARSTPRRGSGFRRLSSPTRTISAIFCNRASPRATTSASPINSRRGRSASASTSSTAGGRLPTRSQALGVNMAANYNITRKLHINASIILQLYLFQKPSLVRLRQFASVLQHSGVYGRQQRHPRSAHYWEEGQEGYAQRNWNHVWFNNPWFVAEEYTRPYSEPELIASASLDYDITDDLNFMVKAATNSKHQNQEGCKAYVWWAATAVSIRLAATAASP